MSETLPTTSSGPDQAERRGMPSQAPGNDTLERRVAVLEQLLREHGDLIRLPDAHPTIYPANHSGNGFWQELVVNAGALINLGTQSGTIGVDILGCNETLSGSTLLHLADGQGLVVETEDATGMRPVWVPNAATATYLSNNTGGGYDVYADAGRTIKLATNLTPETASGLFQWNGTNGRLIVPSSTNATQTVSVVTALTVVGSNATLNKQNLTVLATGATSSSNITLPSGGTTLSNATVGQFLIGSSTSSVFRWFPGNASIQTQRFAVFRDPSDTINGFTEQVVCSGNITSAGQCLDSNAKGYIFAPGNNPPVVSWAYVQFVSPGSDPVGNLIVGAGTGPGYWVVRSTSLSDVGQIFTWVQVDCPPI